MNIGETSAAVMVMDAPAGAAVAAPVAGGAVFADRLAAALGVQGAAGSGVAGDVVGGEAVPVAVTATVSAVVPVVAPVVVPVMATHEVLAAKPLTVGKGAAPVADVGPVGVDGAEAGPVRADLVDAEDVVVAADPAVGAEAVAAPVVPVLAEPAAGFVPVPEGVPEGVPKGMPVGVPVAEGKVADDGAETDRAADDDAAGDAVDDGMAAGAVPVVCVGVLVPVPASVSLPVVADRVAPLQAAGPQAAGAGLAKPQREGAGAVAVAVTLVAPEPAGLPFADLAKAVPVAAAKAKAAPVSDAALLAAAEKDEGAPVDAPAKAKETVAAPVVADPARLRVADPVMSAGQAEAAKPEVKPADAADPAAPQVQQMPQPVSLPVERMATQAVRTDLPGWERVLTERIAADLSEDGQEIELSLNPEKLGPLRIKLEMVDGLAQVKFITATPEAARVFTEAQHRLSEGLARAGVDLGSQSAQSGAQSGGQSAGQGGAQRGGDGQGVPRGRMTEFMTRSGRIEAGDAPALRRAGAGLVNLMA